MSNIKVCVKVHALSQREKKSKTEEQWKVTDNNSLQCTNLAHPCEFTFDYVFGTKSLNYEVYTSIVKPIFEACLIGFNGTVLTYGSSSAEKNYTMIGTNMDPGILLMTVDHLFVKIGGSPHHTVRFGYIEIYKEKIYDLLNDRKPVSIDQNKKFDFMLSNDEIVAENFEKAVQIMVDGSYKRKSATEDGSQLSSLSHSIFRITIESEDKTNGKIQISYLRFVHVADCERMAESPLPDLLEDESNKSLHWFNVVIDGLNKGENNIDFNNSILTMLLRESLTGKSNTAIVCNIRPDSVEKTISTLKFVSKAKNVRTFPMRNEMYNARASSSPADDNQIIHLENQLKEISKLKVENLLLRNELEEVKTTSEVKRKWFAEQMKCAELAQQKLEHALMEQERIKNGLELQIEHLTSSNEHLLAKLEELHNGSPVSAHHKSNQSLIVVKSGTSMLEGDSAKFVEKQQRNSNYDNKIVTGTKRKASSESDWSDYSESQKGETNWEKADVVPLPFTGYATTGENSDGRCNDSPLNANYEPNESLSTVKNGTSMVTRDSAKFVEKQLRNNHNSNNDNRIVTGTKRKASSESDWSECSESQKGETNWEKAQVDPSPFTGYATTRDKSVRRCSDSPLSANHKSNQSIFIKNRTSMLTRDSATYVHEQQRNDNNKEIVTDTAFQMVPSPSTEYSTIRNRDRSETCTVTVRDSLVGRLMGPGGSRLNNIRDLTGVSIKISARNGKSDRSITVNGNSRAVGKAVDMIKERLESDD